MSKILSLFLAFVMVANLWAKDLDIVNSIEERKAEIKLLQKELMVQELEIEKLELGMEKAKKKPIYRYGKPIGVVLTLTGAVFSIYAFLRMGANSMTRHDVIYRGEELPYNSLINFIMTIGGVSSTVGGVMLWKMSVEEYNAIKTEFKKQKRVIKKLHKELQLELKELEKLEVCE